MFIAVVLGRAVPNTIPYLWWVRLACGYVSLAIALHVKHSAFAKFRRGLWRVGTGLSHTQTPALLLPDGDSLAGHASASPVDAFNACQTP